MRRLLAVFLAVGALVAAAALPGAALAFKFPSGSDGSCGTPSSLGFIETGLSRGNGNHPNLNDCAPGPNP